MPSKAGLQAELLMKDQEITALKAENQKAGLQLQKCLEKLEFLITENASMRD